MLVFSEREPQDLDFCNDALLIFPPDQHSLNTLEIMKRLLACVILILSATTPASAAPIYVAVQLGETAASALMGYRLNEKYSVEAHYHREDSQFTHAGVSVDTTTVGTGIVAVA